MTKSEANRIAQIIINCDLKEMMRNAQNNIKDWTIPSKANATLSLGTAWNILSIVDFEAPIHYIVKRNMVLNFGDYLRGYALPKFVKPPIKCHHQEPKFIF